MTGELMTVSDILASPSLFSEALFEKMKQISPGIRDLELYEFRYGLFGLLPGNGWGSVTLESRQAIEMATNATINITVYTFSCCF